jgi:hypothetical protein
VEVREHCRIARPVGLLSELEIMKRGWESKHRTGILEVRERDGLGSVLPWQV